MTQPVRTLFVIPSLGQGGAESQLVDLVNGLDSDALEKHLVCFELQQDNLKHLDDTNVRFTHIPRRGKFDLSLIPRLADYIKEHDIQVVHATLLFAAFFASAAIRISGRACKLVVAIHSTISRSLKTELIIRTLYQRALKQADKLIFVSNAQKDYWIGKYPWMSAKSITVHNGINPAEFSRTDHEEAGRQFCNEHAIDPDKPVISCIAAFRVEKNHLVIIDAFSKLSAKATLCFAGAGPCEVAARKRINELGLQDRVRFVGRMDDVRPLLAISSMTVLASKSEAFSMAMLESLSMKVPMLATDVGGMKEGVIPGQTGELVVPGDVGALHRGMEKMLGSRSALVQMGAQGRALVEASFTKEMMIQKTLDILVSNS